MGKNQKFTGLNTDIERLANRIETYLQENGFEVALSKDPTAPPSWFFIQARKVSALRTVAGARRSTDITIKGAPENFEVSVGTGEWGKNLVSSAPLFIVPVIGIGVTLAKLYTAKRFEDNLWKFIADQSRFLADSAKSSTSKVQVTESDIDSRSYDCDYVEGYPGWDSPSDGGKIVLYRQRGGKNRIAFKAKDQKEISISAGDIIEARIISRKKGAENDMMIQLSCKENGGTIKPVFNLHDDIIRGVLAGIDELAGEDKVLRSFEHVSVTPETKYCTNCGSQIAKDSKFCSSCGQKQT